MSVTTRDARRIPALTREDAIDIALRRWREERWTVLTPRADIECRPVPPLPSRWWVVTAEVQR